MANSSSHPRSEFHRPLENGVNIKLYHCNIAEVYSEVVVCSNYGTSDYNSASGIASYLKKNGGKTYLKSLQKAFKPKNIKDWDILTSAGGDLPFQSVFHAIVPPYPKKKVYEDCKDWICELREMYKKILKKVDDKSYCSVTLPFLGAGLAGGPEYECLSAIENAVQSHTVKHLMYVNVASLDRHLIQHFKDDLQSKTDKTKSKPKRTTERPKSPYRQSTSLTNSYSSIAQKQPEVIGKSVSNINNLPSNIEDRKRRPNLADKITKKSDNVASSTNGKTHRQDGTKEKEEYLPLKNGNSDSAHDQFKLDEARKNRKTSRKCSREYQNDDDCDTSFSSIEDTVSVSIRKHKHKESSVDKICGHCKKVYCKFDRYLLCRHTVCGKCGETNEVCPSLDLSTCEHCNKKFTGPDCSLSCGHSLCLECGASNDVCPIARDKDPEYENTLQREMQNGSDDEGVQSEEEEEEEDIETCAICMEVPLIPKHLNKCGHVFCTECIETCFKQYKPVCPTCGTTYGILTGDQPPGVMKITKSYRGVEGEERAGCYQLNYAFSSGVQDENHPNPGTRYLPTSRTAYLPATSEGKKVCKMLIVAFKRKLIFTVGRSTTTGQENRITWNDIHHKTSMSGGPTHFGYPDPTYLNRVKEELASKGITEDDIREVRLRDSEVIYD